MANSSHCYLPRFTTAVEGPKRLVSMKTRPTPLQHAQLLTAFHEGRLDSVLWATWGLVLHYYVRSEDICFGYQHIDGDSISSRHPVQRASISKLSAVRLAIDENDSIQTIVDKVRNRDGVDSQLGGMRSDEGASDGGYLPFNTILMLRTYRKAIDKTSSPLSQQPMLAIALPDQCLVRLHVKVLRRDITIFLDWRNGDMSGEQMKSVAHIFEQMLGQVLSSENTAISQLNLFSDNDWQRIRKWNSHTPKIYDWCIHDAIRDQALSGPDREAVSAWDGSLTYGELDVVASKLACQLRMQGVGPEGRVALCFDKSKWNIVAMLGVMKAGGAFVPLDPTHPTSRLQRLIESVKAEVVLCSPSRVEALRPIAKTLIPLCADTLDRLPGPAEGVDLASGVTSQNAAYVLFTSGSTGEPKGTLLEHRAFLSSAMVHGPGLRVFRDTRALHFAAHTFDASLAETLTPLIHGACVCIPSEETRLNDIVGFINEHRVNQACFTPSFIGFIEMDSVPGLQSLVLAGEAMSQSQLATWSKIKLVNGYGPTEASVASVLNSNVTPTTDCKDIGLPVGVRSWLVDPANHDQLVPVGCPGELLLEGPTLARCYVNNPEKTNESFIYDPAWVKFDERGGSNRRFYKTGDLVRYNSDTGAMNYIGRKDTQVKVHGQRIELGEIENQLNKDDKVTHCSVFFPKAGFSQGRLAAVISSAGLLAEQSDADLEPLRLIPSTQKAKIVRGIRERLGDRLPTYMVPSVWLCVESMPLLPSGKLDRKGIASWVTSMETDPDLAKASPEFIPTGGISEATNEKEEALVAVYSRVLNIPQNLVRLDESFLAMGGDSIAAMTCIGMFKKRGIGLSVQDVLRSKSIRDLASRARAIGNATTYQEAVDQPFELSPIQHLHFGVRKEGQGHFNQGILTRLSKPIDQRTLSKAIETLVSRHSMLRARFDNTGFGTALKQRITQDVKGSFRLRTNSVNSMEETKAFIGSSQSCINAFTGPLLAADYFRVKGEEKCHVLSMTAHHLVVDIVSWRIILEDLEDLLVNPGKSMSENGSLPFQTWCKLQEEYCKDLIKEGKAPTSQLPVIDFGYWGLKNSQTTYGDVDCASFEIDVVHSNALMMECHKALNTEPIDIFLASMLHSFGKTFTDRPLPTVYNEGHGREVWDPSIDISHTVGWFTILHPIFVPDYKADSAIDTLIQIKDLRRRVSDNGRAAFASRVLQLEGKESGRHPHPFEMSFNYVGQHRDLQRKDGLFQLVDQMAGEAGQGSDAADFGKQTPRFGLFEISAMVVAGKIRFTFSFNKFMQHQNRIHDWVSNCQQQLVSLSEQLSAMSPRLTLSSFPMLSLNYETLDKLLTQKLPAIGVRSSEMVEDIYPCSRMQQGILLGRARDSSYYAVHDTFKVRGTGLTKPNLERLIEAWKQVISHHAMFRTIFVENLTPRDPFSQVVLKEYDVTPVILQSTSDNDVLATFDAQGPKDYSEIAPAYRFSICETPSRELFCRIELSHAAMDGNSISIIMRDLQLAYAGRIGESRRPLFKDYIQYLLDAPQEASIKYWRSYLSDARPCLFPILTDDQKSVQKSLRSVPVSFNSLPQLQSVCESKGITLSNVFNAAWGLTLRMFCGSNDVSFSYMASLRDVPADGVQWVVGPVINLMVCRMKFSSDSLLTDVLEQIQNDYMESLPYRHTSLIDIQHALKLSDANLFNSGVSYRRLPGAKDAVTSDIECVEVGSIHDPAEFPVFINIEAMDTQARIDLNYWTTNLSDDQAANVANTYVRCLESILTHPDSEIGQLDCVSDSNKVDIQSWNRKTTKGLDRCVHEVVQKMAKEKPDYLAIAAWDGNLTYFKLDQYSSRLASYLVTFGVGPGSLIPICFEKSVWNTVAMLAIMKAGGGCIPVDSAKTMALIDKWVLENAVQVALASPEKAQILEETISYVIPVSESLLEYLNDEPLPLTATPSDPAYVVFTSGTSRRARGAVLDHGAIMSRADAFASCLGLANSSRTLQFAAHTSDVLLLETFGTLSRGGCVCIPADIKPANLAASISVLHANVACITPTIASFMAPKDVSSLKIVAFTGESASAKLLENWETEDLQIHLLYGTAEGSSASMHCKVVAGMTEGTIGTGVSAISWIIDATNHNALVPVGAIGELAIEGPVLARGYLDGKDLDESDYFENPAWIYAFPGSANRRFFKTGDLVRYNTDGSLVFIGRKSVHGVCFDRTNLQQTVQAFLGRNKISVIDILTLPGADSDGMVAFIGSPGTATAAFEEKVILTFAPELKSTIASLHTHLTTKVSTSKVPSTYIPISALPLTPFGKLNYQALKTELEALPTSVLRSFDFKHWSGAGSANRTSSYGSYISNTHLAFWKEYLTDVEPCNFPPIALQANEKEYSTRTLNKQTQKLHTFSKMSGVSMETLFQTAWGIVLRCYTGGDDVCFGFSTESNAQCVSVCRILLNNDRKLEETLQQSKAQFDKCCENFADLAVIQHHLGLDDANLFNTLLTYQTASSLPQGNFGDSNAIKDYKVAVAAVVSSAVAEIHFTYSADTLTSTQITHVIDVFDHILNDIMSSNPRYRTVGDLDLFPQRSCRQIREWNAKLPPRMDACADELIQQQALLHPRAEAICSWEKNFTYGQLEIVASRLGRHLTHSGVKPEAFVVLCFEKSAWAVVAQLAVLKAGGAFVSIDPSHPDSRLQMLINEIGADLVLCSSSLQSKLSKLCKKAFPVSQNSISQLPESPLALPGVRPTPQNAAYAIFTSGTTGKPKATVVEHVALSTTAIAMMDALHMNSGTRALQFSNYTFDVSVLEIMMTLMTGGCVCVPSEEERMNNLGGAIRRMEANYMASPPAIVNTLEPKTVPTLKTIITGGEKMPANHIDRWHDRFVINAYGPSEATVVATVGVKVDWEGNRVNDDPTSIGTAANCRVWIVDPNNYNRLLPVGAVGEMLLEGSNIAREYLGNPEKTKAAFVDDPIWSNHSGMLGLFKRKDRMYRTGDLVRYNSDGTLAFISRKDTQIKFNGQRIELEEIEQQCLRCLPEGSQVAVDVVVPQERTVAKGLAAFFTVHDQDSFQGGSTDQFVPTVPGADPLLLPISVSNMDAVQKLKSSLPDLLPQSMMPRLFFPLRNLPFTSSAKIDRRRLRAMVQTLPKETLKSYVTFNVPNKNEELSTNGVDAKLRDLWEKTLDLEPGSVTNEDSFFALGGDSFSAMNLVGAAQAQGMSLNVATIFKTPVLFDMAKSCSESIETPAPEQVFSKPFSVLPPSVNIDDLLQEVTDNCVVSKEAVLDVYPCSAVQEGLLTMSIKHHGAYVAQPAFRLADGADLNRFKAAWQQTVADLDILRTRIVHTEAMNFAQVVLKEAPIDWVHAESFDELPSDILELPKHNGAPLTGYAIVQPRKTSACYFVWSVHHALYDGWSIPLVYRKLEENYNASQERLPAASYGLFIDYLSKKNMEESDAFWKTYLANMSATPFPQNKNSLSDAIRAGNTQYHSVEISRPANSVDFTLPVLLRAAWAIVVATHTSTGDVCFGETLSGRNIDLPGVGNIAGPVLTTVPTRIMVDNQMTIVKYLDTIHQSTTDMIPHLHAGLQRIRSLNNDTSAGCGFQNLLVIQSTEGELDSKIWIDEKRETSEDFFTHPLVIECGISKTCISFTVHHDELVINGWQSKRLAQQFGHVIKQLMSIPKASSNKLVDLEIVSPEDKMEISRWNERPIAAVERCVHEFIQDKCLETPDAPAVCAWDGELTYKEFWALASSFASYLVSRGVGPEVFVPVCLDKSAWAMVTLISILIAGGGYVPLDPHHPVSRHEEILKDVSANMILCTPKYTNRYTRAVKTVIPISKETLKAYGARNVATKNRTKVVPSNMAYTLFTSGSTGRAKGIVVEHRNVVSSIMAFGPMTLMGPKSRVFQFASLTFDAAIMETLAILMLGGCICVPSEDERLNDIAGAIRRLNVTWTFLTPSIASIIEPASVPSLEILIVGGEKMSQEVITKWANVLHLMNGYGPTETVVFAVVDTAVAANRDPARIGYGIPCTLTWIVDAENHDRLAPLGAVGELALEGPALAREYLKNPEKNAESFVTDPAWVKDFELSVPSPRRIYKTGDLCYYNPDGSIEYISRKDHQVKLHGQRMELGEIEHRLYEDKAVRHAVVILPKTGPLKQRLVTVMSANKIAADNKLISDKACELLDDEEFDNEGLSILVEVQKNLEAQLPVYMVPQTWALIKKLPMLVSGKLDRKKITAWLETIDDVSYERIMQDFDRMKRGVTEKPQPEQEKDGAFKIIREIFAQVLNISLQKVNVDRSFVSLGKFPIDSSPNPNEDPFLQIHPGGDSITGMAVISRARKQGLVVTLNDILQSRSVKELAQTASAKMPASGKREEKSGEGFGLSPIQKLYMQSSSSFKGVSRFNQSITVRIARRVEAEVLRRAVKAVTSQHSMFQARFKKGKDGIWQQKTAGEVDASYRFRVHSVSDTRAMVPKIAESQSCLDPLNGPIFAADLFNLRSGGQVLFLVGHHLCVDMVSWRIILQDLEELVVSGSLSDEKPLSFQSWCAMQLERAKTHHAALTLPFIPAQPDMSYWGMRDTPNLYGDLKMESFTLSEETTKFLLTDCHDVFGTETVDILLAAIVHSFRLTFTDRNVPTVYNEGHGREPWDASIDLSRTVGWFTTMAPLLVNGEQGTILDTIKRVKDTRRKLTDNGRPYFAKSLLASEQQSYDNFQLPLEILFNYLGKLQQLERADSLFCHQGSVFDSSDFAVAGDMGPETNRFALFELSAIVIKERLNVSFAYNRKMSREPQIRRWILQCKQTLEKEMSALRTATPEPTLSDYPLLPINYNGLQILFNNTFRKLSIGSKAEVEDIYPCSPMQEGLLLSQLRDSSAYMFHTIFEIRDARSSKVDSEKLAWSWQMLVDRHPVLRTVFIDSNYTGGSFDQLVFNKMTDNVLRVECPDSQVEEKLAAISLRDLNAIRPAKLSHQFTVCRTTSGRVLVKLEINHAIIDGGGVDVLLRDLTLAYDNRLADGPGPRFSEYIRYIRSQSQGAALDHWKEYLSGVRPCHIAPAGTSQAKRELKGILMNFTRYPELLNFCEQTSVTLANLTLSAWAIVLQKFTHSDDVCFGYLSAGRDAPVNGIQDMVGIFINMLCCRVQFVGHQSLTDVSKRVNGDYIRSIPHQSCSLASIQHELGWKGQSLFNTTLSIQNHTVAGSNKEKGLSFDLQHAHDPSEYAVTVNVDISRGKEGIMLRYWNDVVSDDQAHSLVNTIAKVFTGFIESPSATISSLQFESRAVEEQPLGWDNTDSAQSTVSEKMKSGFEILDGSAMQKLIDNRVHEIIGQMLRDGKLMVPHIQPDSFSGYCHPDDGVDSPYPLEAIQGGADDSGVCSATSRSSEDGLLADLERRLWSLWSTALGLSPHVVRHQDSFFKLGGDSITAMKMVSAAREDGLVLTVADVFNNPVFEDMLATVRAANATQQMLDVDLKPSHKEVDSFADSKPTTLAPTPSSESISVLRPTMAVDDALVQSGICPKIGVFKGGIADVLPVTDFQAMSLTATLFKSRWMLNYFFLEGNGPLDLRRLRESCLKVVDAFDILRTVFVCFHDQFFQVVLRKIRPSIFVYETDRALDEFTMNLQQRDREYGPREGEQYVQFYVVKKKESDQHRIMIRLSHTQYDGVCLSKIMSAIKLGYEGSPLPPVTPFASYLRQLPGTITPDHYNHWSNLLKGSQMTQVVRRKGTSMFQNIGAFTEIRKTIEIPPNALGNVTIATLMQAAWAITLAKVSAQSDVVFGLTISGRNATVPGIETTVGPCVNVIPVRVRFDEKWTGLELFRSLQDQQVSNMPFESLGFREIIKQCTDWPAWTYFTTSVFHQNVDYEGSLELDNTKYRMGGAGVNDNFADLTMVSRPADERNLNITLGFSERGPIIPAFATRVLGMVCEIAQSLVANPSTALPSPSMLRSLPPQVVDDLSRSSDEHFLSAHLKSRSIAELLVHSDILSRSWHQVLPSRAPTTSADSDSGDKTAHQTAFQLDSSFFDLGGDIFNMAQLTWILEQEGLKVRLEDLLEHPSFLGQMAVLALHNAKHQEDFGPDFATDAVSPRPTVNTRGEKKKTWEKAMTLARKLTRRNNMVSSRA
ncbi:Nonribosomal peptide synthetase 1 [Penicillium canariense]|uniref:Nonribosomal peptide synthetase 1 n=1 Tax=Penicillium canariense TaxID=189055 RepID=A0A9W9HYY7_9EURO|nr:Nonribosomal peptide synthetase 1 [Penicillium canariense]KAJ5160376.1 Nonribosomal peptide synthetase 1 [Penicillium canariense]